MKSGKQLRCDSSEIDSASEDGDSKMPIPLQSDDGRKKKKGKVGECVKIPEVEILHVEPGLVSRQVEIIRVDPPPKENSDIQVLKYMPGHVSAKCKEIESDVSEVSRKRQKRSIPLMTPKGKAVHLTKTNGDSKLR